MAWYTLCPVCHTVGSPMAKTDKDNQNDSIVTYLCPNCTFSWRSVIQCKFNVQNDYGEHFCVRDTNIGECKGENCPRLNALKYEYIRFSKTSYQDYIRKEGIAPQDIPKEH